MQNRQPTPGDTPPPAATRLSSLTADRLDQGDSLRDQALRVLRQAIVSGQIHADGLYSATALARQLGVSVSPVREAMLTLVNEGTMEPVRNRGFRVVPLEPKDLDEIVQLRMLLEVPAVCGLAQLELKDQLPDLERQAHAIERAATDGDVPRFLAADRDFHLALLELTGNHRLVALVARLRDQTRLYGMQALASRGLLTESAAEHSSILRALSEGDPVAVEQLMTRHLSHIKNEWSTGAP